MSLSAYDWSSMPGALVQGDHEADRGRPTAAGADRRHLQVDLEAGETAGLRPLLLQGLQPAGQRGQQELLNYFSYLEIFSGQVSRPVVLTGAPSIPLVFGDLRSSQVGRVKCTLSCKLHLILLSDTLSKELRLIYSIFIIYFHLTNVVILSCSNRFIRMGQASILHQCQKLLMYLL